MSFGQERNEGHFTGGSSKDLTKSFNIDEESGPKAAEMSASKLKNTLKWVFCLLCVFSFTILMLPSKKRIFNYHFDEKITLFNGFWVITHFHIKHVLLKIEKRQSINRKLFLLRSTTVDKRERII